MVVEVARINQKVERESNEKHLTKLVDENELLVERIEVLKDVDSYKLDNLIDAPELHTNIAALLERSGELIQHITRLKGMV